MLLSGLFITTSYSVSYLAFAVTAKIICFRTLKLINYHITNQCLTTLEVVVLDWTSIRIQVRPHLVRNTFLTIKHD